MNLNRFPIPFLILAILGLLAGLWAGLMRLGWQLPTLTPSLAMLHGPLMISGFLGTLITLERAVAMKQTWMYLPPLLSGLGWLLATIVPDLPFGVILLTLASLGGVAILTEIVRRENALHTMTMLFGAAAWFTGNLLWMFGWQMYQVVFLWMAFLVLTIAGERLELSRVLRPTSFQQTLFSVITAIFITGVALALFNLQLGTRLSGLGLLLLPLWSLRNDIAWFTGNLLWMFGWQMYQVVFLWMAFLVLTIAGERLELSRVLRPTSFQQTLFSVITAIFITGVALALFNLQLGTRLSGLGLLLLPLWSLRNDIAWRNLRHKLPLTRYIAWCLALGFVWLGVGGGLSLVFGAQVAGPRYDAVLHAVFVGFVISMIFGHAPIIFPAILGAPINFQPAFYFHLGLLHVSLAIRIFADYANLHTLRMWGGLLNELAIFIFIGMTVMSVRKSLSMKG